MTSAINPKTGSGQPHSGFLPNLGNLGMLPSMSEKTGIGEHLRALRERKGFSRPILGKLVDAHPNTIQKLENEDRKLTLQWIEKIAPHVGVTPTEFLNRKFPSQHKVSEQKTGGDLEVSQESSSYRSEQPPTGTIGLPFGAQSSPFDSSGFLRDVPVKEGAICGEDGAFEFESQIADFAPRPPRLKGVIDAYAVYIRGDSMEPWREQGQIVYVHPGLPPRLNDYVIVQLRPNTPGGMPAAYVKRLVGRNAREIRVLQYNPRKHMTFPLGRILSMHRIIEWADLLGA